MGLRVLSRYALKYFSKILLDFEPKTEIYKKLPLINYHVNFQYGTFALKNEI